MLTEIEKHSPVPTRSRSTNTTLDRRLISLIVPARNEEGNLSRLHREIAALKSQMRDYDFEVVFIDNASEDKTGEVAQEICKQDPDWKYLRFSRNFGSEASLAAGLQYCTGDACVILFSDLQDPPEKIPELVQKWREGYDIVYGVYTGNKHAPLWKRYLVSQYYKLLEYLSDSPMIPFAADFRIYDRRVIDILNQLQERNRYLRGLAQWVGFRTASVPYERRERIAGKSKAPFFYLFGFALSVIVNFSDKPLRLFIVFGLCVMVSALSMMAILLANTFLVPVVPGLSTTHVLLAFNLAFMALGFGVLGEYIGKIYVESKNRPLFIIDRMFGFPQSKEFV